VTARERLDAPALARALEALPAWQPAGQGIARTWRFRDFREAMTFVNRVADLAEQAGHHPDIAIQYSAVTLTLWTHTAGGVTPKDLDLARTLDGLG
jgi:4a-hydroxytetrahydrobiopterin dehydratase